MQLLITRPEPHGQMLATLARELGLNVECYPLITIDKGRELHNLQHLQNVDYLIVVSQHAVNFASDYLVKHQLIWPSSLTYFSVGQQTAYSLLDKQINKVEPIKVLCPTEAKNETTEGLLALPELQNVLGKKITILRGNGGREDMAFALEKRGAELNYIECYQRIPQLENQRCLQQTLLNNIEHNENTILVVTSMQLLKLTVEGLPVERLVGLTLIVPSIRIESYAKKIGFLHIYLSQGASNNAIIEVLKNYPVSHGRSSK